MKICGIIAEYNPFHNGHAYMMKTIREHCKDAVIVAIMSGSFTQRGEVGILDKWNRAKTAVENGCDVVFELPFAYAVRSGEFFADGAVKILSHLNIDYLAFGSETNNLDFLNNIAKITNNPDVQNKIHNAVISGASYAQALSAALSGDTDKNILLEPNDILAVEYLKALRKYNSKIEPILIERKAANHNDNEINANISSASAIRGELKKHNPDFTLLKNNLPIQTFDKIQDRDKLYFHENIFKLLLAKLFTSNFCDLQNIYGINEGLEHRILKAAKISQNYDELLQNISAKRYSKSRVSRALTHILTGFTKDMAKEIDEYNSYARLLAFNYKGAKILRDIKFYSNIPIIEKTSRFIRENNIYQDYRELSPLQKSLALDIRATNLQTLFCGSYDKINKDFLTSPIYIV